MAQSGKPKNRPPDTCRDSQTLNQNVPNSRLLYSRADLTHPAGSQDPCGVRVSGTFPFPAQLRPHPCQGKYLLAIVLSIHDTEGMDESLALQDASAFPRPFPSLEFYFLICGCISPCVKRFNM